MGGNAGLSTAVTVSNLNANVSSGVPVVPTPEFKTDANATATRSRLSLTGVVRGMDESVKQPHVHQVSAGITREILWNMAVEARYVGTFGRDLFRGVDLNQLDAIGALNGAFMQDFLRARQNGFLALAAGGAFDPAFNPNLPGSQPLTVLNTFGQLANANVRTSIQQGELARLADLYMTTGNQTAAARAAFLANPAIYAAEYVLNGSSQDYNALQLELRRQFRQGIMGQINYTFSETKSDAVGGDSQSRIEPFLDNRRPELDDGPSIYHTRHVINANGIFELPFGQGKRWLDQRWHRRRARRRLAARHDRQMAERRAAQHRVEPRHVQSHGPLGPPDRRDVAQRATSQGSARLLRAGREHLFHQSRIVHSSGRLVGPDTLSGQGFDGQVFFNPGRVKSVRWS